MSLASSDATEAVVPGPVTLPAGQNSARFVISAVEDFVPDGDESVVITAATVGAGVASAGSIVPDGEVEYRFTHLARE